MHFQVVDLCPVTAGVYSARFISERYLPDKAIDLVDEAASSLRLAQESKPDELERLDRQIITLQIELESLKKEGDALSVERRKKVEKDLKETKKEAAKMSNLWQTGIPQGKASTLLHVPTISPSRTCPIEQNQGCEEKARGSQARTRCCATRRRVCTCQSTQILDHTRTRTTIARRRRIWSRERE